MIDSVQVHLKAGKGGDGHVSFRRLRGKPYGPAEGGDGGKGGDLYLETTNDLNTLLPFQFKKDFAASDGVSGGRNNKKGAEGADLVLKVPVGTLVKSVKGEKLYDLAGKGEKILVVEGGRGGRGNAHSPRSEQGDLSRSEFLRKVEKGKKGEEIDLNLELQVLADVGLIGLPNAGKSTLLAALTAATPKIAAYPFTTLEPNLGVLSLSPEKTLVLADIPGLIEGASIGRGLGDQFLKHIERTRVVLHILDATSASLYTDYKVIRKELADYNTALIEKKEILVLNKVDALEASELRKKLLYLVEKGLRPLDISAAKGTGLEQLKKMLSREFE